MNPYCSLSFAKTYLPKDLDSVFRLEIKYARVFLHLNRNLNILLQLIDYNEDFRLIMTTRNPQPDIPTHATSLISMVFLLSIFRGDIYCTIYLSLFRSILQSRGLDWLDRSLLQHCNTRSPNLRFVIWS